LLFDLLARMNTQKTEIIFLAAVALTWMIETIRKLCQNVITKLLLGRHIELLYVQFVKEGCMCTHKKILIRIRTAERIGIEFLKSGFPYFHLSLSANSPFTTYWLATPPRAFSDFLYSPICDLTSFSSKFQLYQNHASCNKIHLLLPDVFEKCLLFQLMNVKLFRIFRFW